MRCFSLASWCLLLVGCAVVQASTLTDNLLTHVDDLRTVLGVETLTNRVNEWSLTATSREGVTERDSLVTSLGNKMATR